MDSLTLSVSPDGGTASSSSAAMRREPDRSGVVGRARLSGSQLRVGASMVGCVREGPGVRFTRPGVAVGSFAVRWDRCLLPFDCKGKKKKFVGKYSAFKNLASTFF